MSVPERSIPLWRTVLRGFAKHCPNCGKASVFERYLKPTPACKACGEKYDHIRTDDFAPWLTLIVLGHIFVPLVYHLELTYRPPMVQLLAVVIPAVTVGILGALPNFKGASIALMWALGLRGDEQH